MLELEPGRVRCAQGTVSAGTVLRATEAYTAQLPGEGRRFLPLYSLMVATEPLPADVWDEIGWDGGETVSDLRHLFFYAQRTTDDRIAIGGRGAPYRLGSPIRRGHERNDAVERGCGARSTAHFPATSKAAITHHWGGPLGVPRDWCMSGQLRPRDRASAGPAATPGTAWWRPTSPAAPWPTWCCGRDTDLVTAALGRPPEPPSWEPEPLRFVASRAIVVGLGQRRPLRGLDREARPADGDCGAVHATPLGARVESAFDKGVSMRKMLVLLAVAAVAVVAATAAFAGGAPGLTAPRVIHVVERPVTDQVIDIGAKGDSPGDQLPFANPIYDGSNSHRVGSDQGNCVRASASQGRWECMWTTFLRGGQITVEGPFIDSKTNTCWRSPAAPVRSATRAGRCCCTSAPTATSTSCSHSCRRRWPLGSGTSGTCAKDPDPLAHTAR